MRKKTTLINEPARERLAITRDEYALCAYVHYRIADPANSTPGWCTDGREEIAGFVGITRRGLLKMINRMEGKDLLEVGPTGNLRVGSTWIKEENAWEQSSQRNENKVPKRREQSSHKGGNKVPDLYKVKEDNKEEEGETPAPLKTETPHVENEGSPPPMSFRDSPKSQTPSALAEELRALYKAYPNEWQYIITSTPAKVFDTKKRTATVEAFCEWAIGEGWHRRDFGAINARLIKWFKAEPMMQPRAAAPHQAPAVGMRKSVPVYDANGLVTQ